jgi:hypothetical protein
LEGIPERVLVSLSDRADLLVVEDRGHGHVSSFGLGSVRHHVIQRAALPCPGDPSRGRAAPSRPARGCRASERVTCVA